MRIWCQRCAERSKERGTKYKGSEAEHVHGTVPTKRGGKDHRRRTGCWNRCVWCQALYEALGCGGVERARQDALEADGQARLEGV